MSSVIESAQDVVDDAWSSAVGGWDWVKSLILGEFQDNRPLSVLITEMLVAFVPGVVIVTSARDAVAVSMRLAKHPERREHLTEWIVLCACLITIALPLGMAAGGAVFAGVGAVVGGIAGSELGAALRAVMLMLAREAAELMEIVRFLQKFVTGNIMNFLKGVKFTTYEKAIVQALTKVTDPLIGMCKATRQHLERWLSRLDKSSTMGWLRDHFDVVKNSSAIAEAKAAVVKLAQWESAFYGLQRDAVKKIPMALGELESRLAKVLAQAVEHDAHTVSAGVKAELPVAPLPVKQQVADSTGNAVRKSKGDGALSKVSSEAEPPSSGGPKPPKKDVPEPAPKVVEPANTRAQKSVDPVVAIERQQITELVNAGRLNEAREILRPHVSAAKNATTPVEKQKAMDEIIGRLDVSSSKEKMFWSGNKELAGSVAEMNGKTILEQTSGGQVIDGWGEVNDVFSWKKEDMPPHGWDFWGQVSENYAKDACGSIDVIQSADKFPAGGPTWKGREWPTIRDGGNVTNINLLKMDSSGNILDSMKLDPLDPATDSLFGGI